MATVAINEGINSSVVVCEDGKAVFALQEERVNRIKNYMGFPRQALEFALAHCSLKPREVECVCLSNHNSPVISKEDFLALYDATADKAERGLIESDLASVQKRFAHVIRKLNRKITLRNPNQIVENQLVEFGFDPAKTVRFHHHLNHAASAYYALRQNPRDPHLVLTLDGGGDGDCSHVYVAQGNDLKLVASTADGHSIGNIYSRITHLLGMTPHEHEYKIMGLAAYQHRGAYTAPLMRKLESYLDLDPDDPLRFRCKVPELTFAIQPRLARDFKRARFDTLSSALQFHTEDLLLRWVREAVRKTGIRKVVASGGVFMNVKANKLIAELEELEYFDVFPSCGDETLPFGAAWHHHASRHPDAHVGWDHIYLGPDAAYDLEEARKEYAGTLAFERLEDPEEATARLLAEGKIVARCSGRMEFGSRALGNRSILADPAIHDLVPEINAMIKKRDFWMPFAPAVLREAASNYLVLPRSLPSRGSPWMMHTFDSTEHRGEFVAGVHAYDRTARAQTVVKEMSPEFHRVIERFAARKNKEVVLNTSFNLHGFPIVMGARDAMQVMLDSSLEYLVVNDVLITKKGGAALREGSATGHRTEPSAAARTATG